MSVDLTKPVQTRAGNKVRILCMDVKDSNQPVLGLVDFNGREFIETWKLSGKYCIPSGGEHEMDLINVPVKHECWVNIYVTGKEGSHLGDLWPCSTKKEADDRAKNNRVACIKIEFTEGEGL